MNYKEIKEALEKLNIKDDQEIWIKTYDYEGHQVIWIKTYDYEGHQGKHFISRAVLTADSDSDVQCYLEADEK